MGRKHVLLLDQDMVHLRINESNLRQHGFLVSAAPSGREGLKQLGFAHPDIIIADVELRDQTGFDFRRAILPDPVMSEIPFIFTANTSTTRAKVEALKQGVEVFLVKPLYSSELVARINLLISRRESEALEKSRRKSLRGELSQRSLADLILLAHKNRHSCIIELNDEKCSGRLYIQQGDVIDAEMSNISGERAFFRLLTWMEGRFEVRFKTVPRTPSIQRPTRQLLVEALGRAEEWRAILEQLPDLNQTYEIAFNKMRESLYELPSELNPLMKLFDGHSTLAEIVDTALYDDLDTLTILSRLYFEGFLVPLPAGSESGDIGNIRKWLGYNKRDSTPVEETADTSKNDLQQQQLDEPEETSEDQQLAEEQDQLPSSSLAVEMASIDEDQLDDEEDDDETDMTDLQIGLAPVGIRAALEAASQTESTAEAQPAKEQDLDEKDDEQKDEEDLSSALVSESPAPNLGDDDSWSEGSNRNRTLRFTPQPQFRPDATGAGDSPSMPSMSAASVAEKVEETTDAPAPEREPLIRALETAIQSLKKDESPATEEPTSRPQPAGVVIGKVIPLRKSNPGVESMLAEKLQPDPEIVKEPEEPQEEEHDEHEHDFFFRGENSFYDEQEHLAAHPKSRPTKAIILTTLTILIAVALVVGLIIRSTQPRPIVTPETESEELVDENLPPLHLTQKTPGPVDPGQLKPKTTPPKKSPTVKEPLIAQKPAPTDPAPLKSVGRLPVEPGKPLPVKGPEPKVTRQPDPVVAKKPEPKPVLAKKPEPVVVKKPEPKPVLAKKPEPRLGVKKRALKPPVAKKPPLVKKPDASRHYRRAVALHKRGIARKNKKLLTLAATSYKKALKIDPGHQKARVALSNVYLDLKKTSDATRNLKKVTKVNPKNATAFLTLGSAYQQKGKNAQAIRAYKKYLKAAPNGRFAGEVRKIIRRLQSQ